MKQNLLDKLKSINLVIFLKWFKENANKISKQHNSNISTSYDQLKKCLTDKKTLSYFK